MKEEKITAYKFTTWVFTCPHCGNKKHITENQLYFNPHDGNVHYIDCQACYREFEVVTEY